MSTRSYPLVSIITPVYNIQDYLESTIKSVVDQTYQNWEFILIDDKSGDSSGNIIRDWEIKDKRIKGVFLNENVGAGIARNKGIENSCGEFIAFLDSDDIWCSNKLNIQVKFLLENQEIDFIYSWYTLIDLYGNTTSSYITPRKISYNLLKYNNYILTSSVMYRKNRLNKIYFPDMRKRQDWVFFLQLLLITRYA